HALRCQGVNAEYLHPQFLPQKGRPKKYGGPEQLQMGLHRDPDRGLLYPALLIHHFVHARTLLVISRLFLSKPVGCFLPLWTDWSVKKFPVLLRRYLPCPSLPACRGYLFSGLRGTRSPKGPRACRRGGLRAQRLLLAGVLDVGLSG